MPTPNFTRVPGDRLLTRAALIGARLQNFTCVPGDRLLTRAAPIGERKSATRGSRADEGVRPTLEVGGELHA